ncbi:hypothetical protein Pcinc_000691 [Petrolisthes cinctipes]|uniref:C-type lectin domain-containing protein n=1 Tax=Petrolisthes cinctipes TaxID=88211 RepID=A0AAE1GLM1_PETCI|nr:hypothetical protein Pcinc_000691 [Petrolisthes cinctipes]
MQAIAEEIKKKINATITAINAKSGGLHLKKLSGDFSPGYAYGIAGRQCDDDPEAQGNQPTLRENYEILRAELDEDQFLHHEGETFFVNRKAMMTWFEGRKWFQARGGELAHPSGNLGTFLIEHTSMESSYLPFWIGATYSSESEQWQWVTGLSIQGDLPWSPERPRTPLTRLKCVGVSFSGSRSYFTNNSCNVHYNVICQF